MNNVVLRAAYSTELLLNASDDSVYFTIWDKAEHKSWLRLVLDFSLCHKSTNPRYLEKVWKGLLASLIVPWP